MKHKVFLGGTCAETTWREELIKVLQVDFFNPVVEDWTPSCIEAENKEKTEKCNIHLYVITKEMQGVYSIAEVIESCMTSNKLTILHVIPEEFTEKVLRSLDAVVGMVKDKGGIAYIENDLGRTARVLNSCFREESNGAE